MFASQERRFIDDLPAIRIPRLRAEGAVDESTTEFVVKLGDVEQTVGVTMQRSENAGSWSLFRCPTCARCARVLRLLNGQVLCTRCCIGRGLLYKTDPMSLRQRAERRIPQLRAMLESKESLRLKPSTLWSRLERRSRLEAALRKAEFRIVHGRASGKTIAVEDPCNEPDFVAPKRPWPRSKPRLSEPD